MLLVKTLKCMFLIKNLRVYTIGKSSAVFSLGWPLCATFPYDAVADDDTQDVYLYRPPGMSHHSHGANTDSATVSWYIMLVSTAYRPYLVFGANTM